MSGKRLTRYITVRWTEDQYEQVMREVERERTTPSRFIRSRVLAPSLEGAILRWADSPESQREYLLDVAEELLPVRTEEPATSRGSEPAS